MLEKSGFEISQDACLIFKEEDYVQDSFVGELNKEYEIIHFDKIVFVESFGRDIVLHTKYKEYSIREKLYQVEGILMDRGFVRINKSTVVSKSGIKRIKPTFNGRIDLIMMNEKLLSVSKIYNKRFRNFIGF